MYNLQEGQIMLWPYKEMGSIPVGARYSSPVETGSGAHPATYTMGIGSFPPYLAPWLKKE